MQNTQSIPIPLLLTKRPKAKNGYVIPYVQLILPNGQPDFRIHNLDKTLHCVRFNLCALCGEVMLGKIWFAGGEHCLNHRKFVDPPAHKECLRYAFRVCPFLACPTSVYSSRNLPEINGKFLEHEKVSTVRPKQLFAMQTTRYVCEVFQKENGKTVESICLSAEPFTKIIEDKDFVK